MEKLYIRINDNQPIEHPILESNFKQAFPKVDINNLPEEFAIFERVTAPILGTYETNQRSVYEKCADNIYRDVWYCDQMTSEEIKIKQDYFKSQMQTDTLLPKSWIFDESTCSFCAPIPYPTDGLFYEWDENILSWVELPTQLDQ